MGDERYLLNKEQLAELRQAFNECDRNSDNFITTKELGWAMRVMGHNPTEAELLQLVNKESDWGFMSGIWCLVTGEWFLVFGEW